MGYRSDVAILMYGEKDECDLVCNLFEQSLDDEGLRNMFSNYKQVYTEPNGMHYVSWCINDVKWYDECQQAKEKLFEFVDELEANAEPKEGRNSLAVEFARIGEDAADVEWDGTDKHNFELIIQRTIDMPNVNWTKGE